MSAPSPSFVLVRTAATSTPYRVRSSPSAIAAAAATVIDVAPSAQRQGEPTLFAIPASLRGVWAPESPAWSVQLKPLESKGVSASFSSDGRHIVLNGPSTAAVRQAVQQLTFAAGRLQEKQPLTHFLSLPLQHPELVDKLSAWMDGVEAKGIDGEVLVKPAKFHVTLGVLSLVTPEAVEQATQLMQTIGAEVYDTLQTRTCLVKVGGLRLMTNAKEEKKNNWADMMEEDARKEPPPPQQTPRRDEPTPDRAHVVYFDVVEADGSDLVRKRFAEQGLLREADRPLKIHATVINTSHRKHRGQGRLPVDASEILQLYASHQFGTYRLESVHLSKFSGPTDLSGYYGHEALVHLP